MANFYRTVRLDPMEETIIQHDIDRLNNGVFTSQTELRAAIANRAYSVEGPLGVLYRKALDDKAARTQAEGASIIGDNRVSDILTSGPMQAGAYRDKNGEIQVGILGVENPNGEVRGEREQASGNDGIKLTNLSGGVTRAELNRESLQTLGNKRYDSDKERLEREAYLKRARERQQ